MATSRSNLPKEMTPFGKGAKKEGNPFADKKAAPFGKGAPPKKGKKPFGFAAGGSIDDGKPSGGGKMKSMGAAKRGGKFQGTF
jgi:hypothetical protein